ncbi:U4/U6 x U5 tri-snRNP complex WD repeat subunit Rna4 [Schizosaccharomyces pombe]|uniref:Uncharacterized WD repeat-containing protein C227.12 n=1 Tax=Schizosaccharomyces pombe (strain 972 / ATCC 24843) TaxID=284812 RepID=YIDC_SCHPO|nr:putative Prp4 family U4/U5/U6 small nuclear ribonucleoprotein complex subunit [Schizosaccharomyces pombe]Q9UTC7.1 RecName: Full=Uncharacterized WD repeat-containing protein C227.12 [Schizosaccharomyces pombe 972h-]CAB61461.1 U4/U6 x U5 tri-snRNP complex subunit Prp4 family (predicted) [Schizosaccharomyces pombe]|eukprot:NP_592966.1 putative Prp4 family U4/U5/U6 small nuclear ribonucleoprotein complex subunit [Schizosaccharomyces pombe]
MNENEGISLGELETRPFSEGITRFTKEQAAYYAEQKEKDRIKALKIPYEDSKVREYLRRYGEPITYFGEDALARRQRLQQLMIEKSLEGDNPLDVDQGASENIEKETYVQGSHELLVARKKIALYSLEKAKLRLKKEREISEIPVPEIVLSGKSSIEHLQKAELMGSQIGGERPIAIVRFSNNGNHFASGSWGGQVKVWNSDNLSEVQLFRGHTDRVSGLDWYPLCQAWDADSEQLTLATGAADNTVCLWKASQSTPLLRLEGHLARVGRVAFHPSGDYLVSASFDTTWRLWDVHTGVELLMQEGHSEGIFSIACQPDGSLVSSGGNDAIGRIWDLRSGKSIMVLDEHIRQIVAMAWSPNGYQLATSSADDTVKIWDLRKVSLAHTIPAHSSLVSDVRYIESGVNRFIATSGYDGCVKLWNPLNCSLIKSMVGHEEKVMSVDGYGDRFISSGYDRTIKLWYP